jgi:hypothetical protein
MPGTSSIGRKSVVARRPAKRVSKKKVAVAKPKAGPYIAPSRPASSGGEGPSVSTYTPVYVPVSSGGEGGGGGGYYVPSSYSYGSSSGGGE